MTNNLYRIFHTCFVYIRVSSTFIVMIIRDIIYLCYKTRAFGMSYSEKDKYIFRISLLYQLSLPAIRSYPSFSYS